MHPPTARGGFLVSDLRRFVPVTLVNIEMAVWDGWHPAVKHLHQFELEGQLASHLDDARGTLLRGDLAIVAR
jgi:glycosyltransferase A (GT-A) superfamily protein (DUF2064 family)